MHTYLFILCKKTNQNPKKKTQKNPKPEGTSCSPAGVGGEPGKRARLGAPGGGQRWTNRDGGGRSPPRDCPGYQGRQKSLAHPSSLAGGTDGFLCQEEDSEEGSILYKAFNCRQEHKLPPPPPP